tara:strand:+ start:14988 stop:15914 length:927 start_codon:yes stop_codon:yes gene_type:complete
MTLVFWNSDYVAAADDFDTSRKSGEIVESIAADPIPGIRIEAPPILTAHELYGVHDPGYVTAVQTGEPRGLAESQGFRWDPGLWIMACAHASGLVAAALHAHRFNENSGSLSSGLHHASFDEGMGFCTFNGVALAATRVLRAGAKRVLILDVDAHGAGGTHSLVHSDSRIVLLDIAVNSFEPYETGSPSSHDMVTAAEDYLPLLKRRLDAIVTKTCPIDLCIYYSGMDPFEGCHIGGLPGIDEAMLDARERLVFEWGATHRVPIAFGIGGGYHGDGMPRTTLIGLHRLTLQYAAGSTGIRRARTENGN